MTSRSSSSIQPSGFRSYEEYQHRSERLSISGDLMRHTHRFTQALESKSLLIHGYYWLHALLHLLAVFGIPAFPQLPPSLLVGLYVSGLLAVFAHYTLVSRPVPPIRQEDVHEPHGQSGEDVEQGGRVLGVWCEECRVYKRGRMYHCRRGCGCVDRMCHHCGFLNTCIDKHNHQLFLAFLALEALHLTLALACLFLLLRIEYETHASITHSAFSNLFRVLSWIPFLSPLLPSDLHQQSKEEEEEKEGETISQLPVSLALLYVAAMFAVFVYAMLGYQLSCISRNVLFREDIHRASSSPLPSSSSSSSSSSFLTMCCSRSTQQSVLFFLRCHWVSLLPSVWSNWSVWVCETDPLLLTIAETYLSDKKRKRKKKDEDGQRWQSLPVTGTVVTS